MKPKSLKDYARACVTRPGRRIRARVLERITKVSASWSDSYFLGLPGDYLVAREDDLTDIYIIKKDIFLKTYERVKPVTIQR